MKKYKIYAGLEGGFGGAKYIDTIDAESEEEAINFARSCAIDEYLSHEGSSGLLMSLIDCYETILKEPRLSKDIDESAMEYYIQEMESWLIYYVEEVKE